MEKPDILIFFSDQHHANYSGFAGHPIVKTPNLDRLADDGTVFDAAYTACPLCVPARCAFLTGQMPSTTGIFTNSGAIPSDQTTFMHSLAANGYETVLCGRMHFMGPDQRHGFTKRIMDELTPLYWGKGGGRRTDLGPFAGTLAEGRCLEIIGGGDSPILAYDRAVTRAAVKYLKADHKKPQCLVVGTYAPHFTYVAPKKWYRYYQDKADIPPMNGMEKNYDPQFAGGHRTYPMGDTLMRRARAAYFGMISFMDEKFGQVQEAWESFLQRSSRQGVTVYMSDHGDEAGEHHRLGKQTFFEGSARIPLIIQGPGIRAGAHIQSPANIVDIGPTLCELTGSSIPPDQDGKSLVPQVTAGKEDPDHAVFSEYIIYDCNKNWTAGRMIRRGKWKLTVYSLHEDKIRLFDMEKDPFELENVANTHPDIVRELLAELQKGWDPAAQVARYLAKQKHHALLAEWGKHVEVAEEERWPVPESARALPVIQ